MSSLGEANAHSLNPSDKTMHAARFKRYLITGQENCAILPSYADSPTEPYVIPSLLKLLELGEGLQAVDIVVQSSKSGLSINPDYITLALATLARYPHDEKVRQAAYKAFPDVCSLSSQLFNFIHYAEFLSGETSGWGRAQRNAIATWYNSKSASALSVEVTKSRARNGWCHKDVIKLAHINPANDGVAMMLKYILKGTEGARESLSKFSPESKVNMEDVLKYLEAIHSIKCSKDAHQVEILVNQHHLNDIHVPTWFNKSEQVWRGLLQHLPITDILPHLARLSGLGMFSADSDDMTNLLVQRLKDKESIHQCKVHPMVIYKTLKMMQRGRSERGKHKWTKNPAICDALLHAFNISFDNIVPTKKRFLMAIDIHMGHRGVTQSGTYNVRNTSPVALLALCLARSEPHPLQVVTYNKTVGMVRITSEMDLEQATKVINDHTRKTNSPSSECASPILWAKETKKAIDVFIVITDCEKWSGLVNPLNALSDYQKEMNIPDAKLFVVSLNGKDISLSSETEPRSIDVLGMAGNLHNFVQAFALNAF